MNKPLVSIIMNCYNGERYLHEALESIINQTYKNWELIFWDNLSTDNSKKIFQNFKDERFKYFLAKEHTVLYEARNLALKEVSGEFIAFLDTDDIWLKNKLSEQIKLFANKNVGLVYGNYWRYNSKNLFKKRKLARKLKLPSGKITAILLKTYFIGMLTVVLRKECLNIQTNVFSVKFDMLSDMDFILRFSKNYEFDCIQKPVAISRQHQNQLQNKNLKKQATQMNEWYENIKLSREFGEEKKLINIKNRCNFFKILSLINEQEYLKSLKEIILHPNYIEKIKLFLILVFPKAIFNRILNLR